MRERTRLILASVTALLGLQIATAYALSISEKPPTTPELQAIPAEIGAWKLVGEQAMEPDVAAYLRPDNYVERNYADGRSGVPVNLFVAYFKSLKSGYGPHSPGICLPGSGWKPKQNDVIQVQVPSGSGSIPVNQYILEKDNENLLVLYWYQNEHRIWAEEFRAKLFMLPDLLRYHQSDVALVRLITRLDPRKGDADRVQLFEFVRSLFPHLTRQFERH